MTAVISKRRASQIRTAIRNWEARAEWHEGEATDRLIKGWRDLYEWQLGRAADARLNAAKLRETFAGMI